MKNKFKEYIIKSGPAFNPIAINLKNINRNIVGFEKDEEYFNAASKKMGA